MEEVGGAAADEDRLSALPDDVLVLILCELTTYEAARTSVLSHRWRHVWALLPRLWFIKSPEPHRLRDALDAHSVLLDKLFVRTDGATPESLAVWLPTAARRVSGHLILAAHGLVEEPNDYDSEEEAAQRGVLEFPCFDKVTKIVFFPSYLGLAVPVTGVFARLVVLDLKRVRFHGPGELGDVVSSPRCPCLQRLRIEDVRGLRDLTIHSESMLYMELKRLRALSRLTVVAPTLKELTVESCFVKSQTIANISAPLLAKLEWVDEYDLSSVHLGKMAHLQYLCVQCYLVYGQQDFMHYRSCLSLLQRFEAIKNLFLTLWYPPNTLGIENYDYLMEDMTVLPDITFLCLRVIANGHAFGASVFHVLRLCTGIRRLKLELAVSEAKVVCSSHCVCIQLVDWEMEELLLKHLEEVEISGCTGTEHEVAFVKRLFDWGPELKEMTIHFNDSFLPDWETGNFHESVSEVKAKDLYQTFQSFSRPGVCMKFYRYENLRPVLYAPKD